MPSATYEDQVPLQTPLCKNHFRKYARRQIQLEIEADNTAKPEERTEKPPQPTRIQPRRTAKDKYLQSKTNAKKRKAEELLASLKKMRKMEDEFENSDEWTTFSTSLNQMETRATKKARRRVSHICPFGPAPWVCSLCVDEAAKLSKEVLLPKSPVTAPVADMAPVGEQLELHSWSTFSKGGRFRFRCGNMDCTIDACGEPMFMFL